MELVKEKWTGKVHQVIIGATASEGGTRSNVVRIGGETTMPFYNFEGDIPNRPVLAMEIYDKVPEEPSGPLYEIFKDVYDDPAAWAKKCVLEFGAEMLSIHLISTHPDEGDTGKEHAEEVVKKVINAVNVPLIIRGCGVADKDNIIIPAVSQASAGERVLLASAVQDNYKTIVASAQADGHCIICESPIDINIAKQVNILVNDMGFPQDRIVMDPTTGGLGYGLEYTFSIMERARLAALGGDTVLAQPFINFIGQESWRAKEAKADIEEWGDIDKRAPLWETVGAISLLQAGADILVMHHPNSLKIIKHMIDELLGV